MSGIIDHGSTAWGATWDRLEVWTDGGYAEISRDLVRLVMAAAEIIGPSGYLVVIDHEDHSRRLDIRFKGARCGSAGLGFAADDEETG